jgi:hypothetical protein
VSKRSGDDQYLAIFLERIRHFLDDAGIGLKVWPEIQRIQLPGFLICYRNIELFIAPSPSTTTQWCSDLPASMPAHSCCGTTTSVFVVGL